MIETAYAQVPKAWLDYMPEYIEQELGFSVQSQALEQINLAVQQQDPQACGQFEQFAEKVSSRIAVHETYFLRHQEQFEWLKSHWLEQLKQQGVLAKKSLRILSAGCSTGEEAYSLYATLAPCLKPLGISLSVDAIDISSQALAIAKRACYRPWSLRQVDLNQHSWLTEHSRKVEVQTWVKQGVNFFQHNLLKPLDTAAYDLIMFRNVSIYMHAKAIQSCFSHLLNRLLAHGFIIAGPSDPHPLCVGGLKQYWQQGIRMYGHDNLCLENLPPQTAQAPAKEKAAEAIRQAPAHCATVDLTRIQTLITQCQYEQAKHHLQHNIHLDCMDVASYVWLMLLAMDLNEYETALAYGQKALFLAPNALYIVYLLEQAKKKVHGNRYNNRQWLWLKEQLAKKDKNEILAYSDELSIATLEGVINAQS